MEEIDQLKSQLAAAGYIADTEFATVIHLCQRLQRPLLLEGDAGVGKTAVAQALASMQPVSYTHLTLPTTPYV